MSHSLVDNAADASQITEAKRLQRRAIRQETSDLRDVADTPHGERYLKRELDAAGVFRTSFSTDPLQMAYAEGRRNGGLRLLALLVEAHPQAAARILTSALTPETPE